MDLMSSVHPRLVVLRDMWRRHNDVLLRRPKELGREVKADFLALQNGVTNGCVSEGSIIGGSVDKGIGGCARTIVRQ